MSYVQCSITTMPTAVFVKWSMLIITMFLMSTLSSLWYIPKILVTCGWSPGPDHPGTWSRVGGHRVQIILEHDPPNPRIWRPAHHSFFMSTLFSSDRTFYYFYSQSQKSSQSSFILVLNSLLVLCAFCTGCVGVLQKMDCHGNPLVYMHITLKGSRLPGEREGLGIMLNPFCLRCVCLFASFGTGCCCLFLIYVVLGRFFSSLCLLF